MTNSSDLGPLILAGSGEYTPTMEVVDRYLLAACDGRPVLLIATACAQEGDERMTWWEELGVAHFRRLGVEALPLRIRDRSEADWAEHAERIAAAGLVWFSGGSPIYLAQAFEGTRSWRALEAGNLGGPGEAGGSGGRGGLHAAAPVRAVAHFDRMEARRPEFLGRIVSSLQPGQTAVGVDEDTAVVWTEGAWRVMGHKRVVVFQAGQRVGFGAGDRVDAMPPPLRRESAEHRG